MEESGQRKVGKLMRCEPVTRKVIIARKVFITRSTSILRNGNPECSNGCDYGEHYG